MSKDFTDDRIWFLPSRMDGQNKNEIERHIANVVQLEEDVRLVLDLGHLTLLDFSGAELLLDLVAQARKKDIRVRLRTKDLSLAALLRFMQFDLIAEIVLAES